MPPSTAAEPASVPATCECASVTTRCPGRTSTCRAISFAIVPVTRNSAASVPVTSAARSWRRCTVGSSPYQSSPTSASAMARRMASVGLVTVSERRSMGRDITGASIEVVVFGQAEPGRVGHMVLAVLLMLAGAVVVLAGLQWRAGEWVESGRWIMRRVSSHALVGMPAAGVMIFGLGLMLIWPLAFLLAFGSALAWTWVMARSAETGAGPRLPETLTEEDEPAAPAPAATPSPQRAAPTRTQSRAAP